MKNSTLQVNSLRFGAYEFDLRAGELRKHGMRIKLQEQPCQILAILLEHRGERSEEHTSELQSPCNLVCRLLLEKKKTQNRATSAPHIPSRCTASSPIARHSRSSSTPPTPSIPTPSRRRPHGLLSRYTLLYHTTPY